MASDTERTLERARRVEDWANLHGMDLETYWPDDETRWVIQDALFCAGDVLMLQAIVDMYKKAAAA